MSVTRPDIPCIDETCTADNVHERAEQIAVPTVDWISMPIVAVLDGLMHIDPDEAEPPVAEPTAAQRAAAANRHAYYAEALRGAASPVNADPKR
ncbi:hypothetical protein ODJ79_17445 [Actinoplanes sp. KI2]|uniref:hypothetical protein n=1 Tax=Actinoplanes sp. KI2 TaxID=2983315 RepID=UPI0021D5AA34|nr:hypothetical protein [Actinoplanes sp. KI2]MCU7725515.1 hypothetical protein [Actinoplanes sp. KI2]